MWQFSALSSSKNEKTQKESLQLTDRSGHSVGSVHTPAAHKSDTASKVLNSLFFILYSGKNWWEFIVFTLVFFINFKLYSFAVMTQYAH